MTSIISAGQSISSIGKSMTAIARVEEHLATFMKKVIYYEKFFQRMGPNLPGGVVSTAGLIFQRCYEYRDEIRDELESTVAYVADAGRWVVGIGDWNSKMEKRLGQISELVLLTNTLLTEYAVTGQVGAEDARDELDAYLQLLSATVTLKKAPVNGPIVKSQETFAREFPASLMPRQEHSASPDASTVSTTPTSTMVSNAAATATTVGGGRTDAAWSTSSGDVTSIAKEPILTAMAPTPTLHPAVEYTHAQASTVLVSEELSNSQSWSENSAQAHGNGHYDETEALVAALAASVAEQQQQRGSDHEYDLFGCAKP
ncbi:hypothetical protein PHYBOEH_003841 [Phytophthora boehmeriae]|uniref:Uncharacterized protein n=1 Tax=Phytophthora boehmeriae TaxID=109152 RepID=A0A8T1XC11_9STRA|nr:hypothetical protein PHYBOEH_003841 [Phytophthora boehmeriae]